MKGSQPFEYRDLQHAGRGGMADVYRCQRFNPATQESQLVAIKQMRLGADWTPERVERFNLECEILNGISSENIVHCYGIDEVRGRKSIVMEFIECTLEDLIKLMQPAVAETSDGAIEPCDGSNAESTLALGHAETIHILRGIFQGLQAIEAYRGPDGKVKSIIHRDIKPSNILITRDGVVKLADFGVSKITDPELTDPEQKVLTRTSVGTHLYKAPEQFLSTRGLQSNADLFAVGAIAFELLTPHNQLLYGVLPGGIKNDSDLATFNRCLKACPPLLRDLVAQLVQNDRTLRPASAARPLNTLKEFSKDAGASSIRKLVHAAIERKEPRFVRTQNPVTKSHQVAPGSSTASRSPSAPSLLEGSGEQHKIETAPWDSSLQLGLPRWVTGTLLTSALLAAVGFIYFNSPPNSNAQPPSAKLETPTSAVDLELSTQEEPVDSPSTTEVSLPEDTETGAAMTSQSPTAPSKINTQTEVTKPAPAEQKPKPKPKPKPKTRKQTVVKPIPEELLLALEAADAARASELSQRKLWCEQIHKPFVHQFAHRYPFAKSTINDTDPARLRRFLHPKTGTLWKAVRQLPVALNKDNMTFRGSRTAAGIGKQGVPFESVPKATLSRSAIAFLTDARTLAVSLYGDSSVDIALTPGSNLRSLTLGLGKGDSVRATNGQTSPKQLDTPLQARIAELKGDVSVNGRVENLIYARRSGAWALFRLLESGRFGRSAGRSFRVHWNKTHRGVNYPASIKVTSKQQRNVLFGGPGKGRRGLLRIFRFQLPERPFVTGPGCP